MALILRDLGLTFVPLFVAMDSVGNLPIFLLVGGIILPVFSINDLVMGKVIETRGTSAAEMVGVVPLGTPSIVGPAVLTTLLVLIEQYFVIIGVVSFVPNLLIQWLLLRQANLVVGFLDNTGVTAISKVVMLLLAAIAVRMIRQGIVAILG
jgi:multiple antibiotic resistance protein